MSMQIGDWVKVLDQNRVFEICGLTMGSGAIPKDWFIDSNGSVHNPKFCKKYTGATSVLIADKGVGVMLNDSQKDAAKRIANAIRDDKASLFFAEKEAAKMNEMSRADLIEFRDLVHELADKGE